VYLRRWQVNSSPYYFKGVYLLSNWIPNELDDDCEFSCSFTGWTSNVYGLEWLRKCFQPATKDKADGRMRLLICDDMIATSQAILLDTVYNTIFY
jgi:hypothetical protein